MVKTQCLCLTLTSLKDMEVERSIEYLLPQVGQKRLWQRKGTNLSFPQCGPTIHSATKRRITTVDHFFDIFHLRRSGMKSIFDFLIIVCKNSL